MFGLFLSCVALLNICGSARSRLVKAGCGRQGYYDPDVVMAGFGNTVFTPAVDWNVTTTFKEASHFTMTDGSVLKLSASAVVRVTDIDEDGTQDLLVASAGKIFYYRQVNGKLEPAADVTSDGRPIDTGCKNPKGTGFAFTDITGDGQSDIIISAEKSLYYYPSSGRRHPNFGARVMLGKLHSDIFDIGDWNRDGLKDIIVGHFNGDFSYYPNVGNVTTPRLGALKSVTNLGTMPYYRYPRILDVNRDGVIDLLYSINWGEFGLCVQGNDAYFNLEMLKLINGEKINVRERYKEHQAPEVADFNGDGIMDLITSGQTGDIIMFAGVDIIQESQNAILYLFHKNELNLTEVLDTDDFVYNALYDSNRKLQLVANSDSFNTEQKKDVFNFYVNLTMKYPQYLQRHDWSSGSMAYLASYIWIIMSECLPDTPENRAAIATITNQTLYDQGIYRDFGIFLINNNQAAPHAVKLIYNFLALKDPAYYSLSMVTQKEVLQPARKAKFSSMRNSSINIFADMKNAENPFPQDCEVCKESPRSAAVMTYTIALAHEVGHNELDQTKALAYRPELKLRKFKILSKITADHVVWKDPTDKGYDENLTQARFLERKLWDGKGNWFGFMRSFFTSNKDGVLCNMNSPRGNLDYFIRAPQEAFATLTNQYFSDSKLMLDFTVERTKKGFPRNLDWFLLVAEYYSRHGNMLPMYVINTRGNMRRFFVSLRRNEEGYINGLTVKRPDYEPGPYVYNFTLGIDGYVTAVQTS